MNSAWLAEQLRRIRSGGIGNEVQRDLDPTGSVYAAIDAGGDNIAPVDSTRAAHVIVHVNNASGAPVTVHLGSNSEPSNPGQTVPAGAQAMISNVFGAGESYAIWVEGGDPDVIEDVLERTVGVL